MQVLFFHKFSVLHLFPGRQSKKTFNGYPSLLPNYPSIARILIHLTLATGLPLEFLAQSLLSSPITSLPLLTSYLSPPQMKAVFKKPALIATCAWQTLNLIPSHVLFFFPFSLEWGELGGSEYWAEWRVRFPQIQTDSLADSLQPSLRNWSLFHT